MLIMKAEAAMYYFIVNPHAKSGSGYKIWVKLAKYLAHSQVEYEAYLTQKPLEARQFAKQLTEGCREPLTIIVVGGDGTMNEVLDGLDFCASISLGYIPAGSGNDLAKSLRLPKSPRRLLKRILNSRYQVALDYGVAVYGRDVVQPRRFMVSSGLGLDASVCHNILESKERGLLRRIPLGKAGYLLIGIKQLLMAKPVRGYLILDGVKKVEFNHIYFVSAHIHPYEGGGFHFAPKADATDGKLSLCVVFQSSKIKLLPVLARSLFGNACRFPGVRNYTCEEVAIHTDRPMAVHVDGENCGCQDNLQIRCIPRKINLLL